MSYEILDHPADVMFRTTGVALDDAFAAVVPAVSELVGGTPKSREQTVTQTVELEARDLEALLIDFLDQLMLFQDLEDAVVTEATDLAVGETDDGFQISAVIHATPIPVDRPVLDVKAPTYSQMRVTHDDDWTIEAVLGV